MPKAGALFAVLALVGLATLGGARTAAAIGFSCGGTASVTASGSYADSTPDKAFDCDDGSAWNAGDYSGQITAKYAGPQTFNAVVLSVNAQPATDESYTIAASNDGANWTTLASATRHVGGDGVVQLDPFTFDTVTEQYLRISVDGGDSWVAINEVTLLTL